MAKEIVIEPAPPKEIEVDESKENNENQSKENTILPLFWDLASLEMEKREEAAMILSKTLKESQESHMNELPKDVLEKYYIENGKLTKESKIEEADLPILCSDSVFYSLNRLIRGLSSSRQGARQGYCLALIELLTILDVVPANVLIQMIKENTKVTGSIKRMEEREMYFGRIFGWMAIMDSGLLFDETKTKDEDLNAVLVDLCKVFKAKNYMQEMCFQLFMTFFKGIKEQKLNLFSDSLFGTESALYKPKPELTPELIILLLLIEQQSKGTSVKYLGNFELENQNELLSFENFSKLAEIFREGATHLQPNLHSCWGHLLNIIFSSEHSVVFHQKFWMSFVDESLFLGANERKMVAFKLLETSLQLLIEKNIKISFIFTPQLTQSLFYHFFNPNSALHKASKATMNYILEKAGQSRPVALQLITALSGSNSFSQTNPEKLKQLFKSSQLMENIILAGLDTLSYTEAQKELQEYCEWLMKSFCSSEQGVETELDMHRQWCLDQMIQLVKNQRIPKSKKLLENMLTFFMIQGFFNCSKETYFSFPHLPSPPLTQKVVDYCQQRFFQMVSDLCFYRKEDEKNPLFEGRAHFEDHVLVACLSMHQILVLNKSLVFKGTQLSGDIEKILKLSLSQVKNIQQDIKKEMEKTEKVQNREINKKRASELLLSLFSFLVTFSATKEEASDFSGLLDEINTCVENIFKSNEGALNPVSVLTEIIVSLLCRQNNGTLSHLFKAVRHLFEICFRALCTDLDPEGLDALLRVIDPTLQDFEEEEEDFDEENENKENQPDNQISFSVPMEVIESHEKAEEEERDLNDEEMVELGFDQKLGEMFKLKQMEQKEKLHSVEYKFRVLELLDIFTKETQKYAQPSHLPLLLQMSKSLLISAFSLLNPFHIQQQLSQLMKNDSPDELHVKLFQIFSNDVSKIPEKNRVELMKRVSGILKRVIHFPLYVENKQEFQSCSQLFLDCLFGMTGVSFQLFQYKPTISFPVGQCDKEILLALEHLIPFLMKLLLKFNPDQREWQKLMDQLLDCHLTKKMKGHVPANLFLFLLRKQVFSDPFQYLGMLLIQKLMKDKTYTKHQVSQLWYLLTACLKHVPLTQLKQYMLPLTNLFQKTLKQFQQLDLQQQKIKDILLCILDSVRKFKKIFQSENMTVKEMKKQFDQMQLQVELDKLQNLCQNGDLASIENVCCQILLVMDVSVSHPEGPQKKKQKTK